jgi:peptidoglycan/LPS O-acetylase OafA/YrhL
MDTRRLVALDGLRGICALTVLFFHIFQFGKMNPFSNGFLSVDIFFLLSGFVLTLAFGEQLAAGMGLGDFMRARIRRLGPVLWFAAGLSVLAFFAADAFSPSHISPFAAILAGLQNAFLIPLTGASTTDAFPLNGPSWSLFAEIWVNAGFALVAVRLTPVRLALIVAAGWLFMIVHAWQMGTVDFGATQSTVLYAIPRSVPSFATGVLIFRLWKQGAFRRLPPVHPMIAIAAWAAITALPVKSVVFELAEIMVTGPVIVILLANASLAPPAWCLWLGRISYPLYATHFIIIHAEERIIGSHLNIWIFAGFLIQSLLLADVLARWCDPATRRRLPHWGIRQKPSAAG